MSDSRQRLGRWGEDLAVSYLEKEGYSIIERNFRTRYGEVDVVASKGGQVIFIEVRTKSSDAYGGPEESITARKREHLMLAAQEYLQSNGLEDSSWRIDLVAVQVDRRNDAVRVDLVENAVEM